MVSFKGKESKPNLMVTRILDENRAPKNKENFKMSENPPRKSATGTSQIFSNRNKGKVFSMENVAGKHGNPVKARSRRKALADVSNLNNNRSNANIKINKATESNACKPRISVTKSVVIGNPSSTLNKENMKSSARATARLTMNAETSRRRNLCMEINSCLGHQINQLTESTKLIKYQGMKLSRPSRLSLATQRAMDINTLSRKPVRESTLKATTKFATRAETCTRRKISTEINICNSHQAKHSDGSSKLIKNQGLKLSRPRLSFVTQKANDAKTISRKPFGTRATNLQANSKLKKAPIMKHKSNVQVSVTAKQCEYNVSSSRNDESVSSQGDRNSCLSDNVTVIISKSKRNRRKSYTSSLVAQSEIMGEFVESSITKNELRNIDDNTNPLEVVEYIDDIYQYYWSMEVQNPLPSNYMSIQSDITPRMRSILVNWLIEVHFKFHLMQETLFLMVQLLDRVLSIVPTKKDELQMVGLTTLLLASKYEDYWHPKINELISISANSFTRDQMIATEKLVLKNLCFRLNLPTPYVFMLRFLKAAESDKKLEHLAFYLVEICLGEYEALKYRPSLLCASAIYVARCNLNITPAWTGLLRKHTRYNESQLRCCAEMILKFHKAACLHPTRITYEKYLSQDRSCVAALFAMEMLPTLT